jgi:hypothetical protein
MLTVNSAATDQLYTTNRHTVEGISPSSNVLGSNDILELIICSLDDFDNFYPTQEINSLRSSPSADQLLYNPSTHSPSVNFIFAVQCVC